MFGQKLKIDQLTNLWLFGHNVSTTYARKPINGLKHSGKSLDSTKGLIQIIDSCSWDPGPDDLGEKGLNLPL